MMFLIAGTLLFTGSIFWTALFRQSQRSAYLIALFLIGYANIILTAYIANSLLVLNQPFAFLTIHLLIALAGWAVWKRNQSPQLTPFQSLHTELKKTTGQLKNNPAIAFFIITITALYLFGLAQILLIPQNSMDGLSTYLSRVGFWLQNGSFFPWELNPSSQVKYPVNAQLPILWTILFLGTDHLAGLVQWVAVLASALGVWGLSNLFGYTRNQNTYSAILFLSLPLIVLQSTTVLTDMVTTAFVIISIYFLILGLRKNDNNALILFAISTGLGVGAKRSFLLFLPIFAIIGLSLLLAQKNYFRKKIAFLLISTLLGISIFGAYQYLSNWRHFGNPFGNNYLEGVLQTPSNTEISRARTTDHKTSKLLSEQETPNKILEELLYNAPRLLYQFADVSGLPRPLSGYAQKAKANIARSFFHAIGFAEIEGEAQTAPGHSFDFFRKYDATEESAFYGPLGFLIILPAMLVGFRIGIWEKNWLKLIPLLTFLFFLPTAIVLRPGWDPYQGRYFAPVIAIATPLVSDFFNTKKRTGFVYVILAFGIFLGAVSALYNPSKPTLGKFSEEFDVWRNERIFTQTIQRKQERDLYTMIEEYVEADAVLAYRVTGYFLNYPLFGEDFSRTLVPIAKDSVLQDRQWAKDNQVDYLLIFENKPRLLANEYHAVADAQLWQLYRFESE